MLRQTSSCAPPPSQDRIRVAGGRAHPTGSPHRSRREHPRSPILRLKERGDSGAVPPGPSISPTPFPQNGSTRNRPPTVKIHGFVKPFRATNPTLTRSARPSSWPRQPIRLRCGGMAIVLYSAPNCSLRAVESDAFVIPSSIGCAVASQPARLNHALAFFEEPERGGIAAPLR